MELFATARKLSFYIAFIKLLLFWSTKGYGSKLYEFVYENSEQIRALTIALNHLSDVVYKEFINPYIKQNQILFRDW